MPDRGIDILPEKLAEPMHPLTSNHIVRTQALLDSGHPRYMTAHDDFRAGLEFSHEAAHFPGLEKIWRNRADRHDVVGLVFQLLDKPLPGWKIQDRARCGDVFPDQH